MSFEVKNVSAGGAHFEAPPEANSYKPASRGLSSRPDELHSYTKAEQNGVFSCLGFCVRALWGLVSTFVGCLFKCVCCGYCGKGDRKAAGGNAGRATGDMRFKNRWEATDTTSKNS